MQYVVGFLSLPLLFLSQENAGMGFTNMVALQSSFPLLNGFILPYLNSLQYIFTESLYVLILIFFSLVH